MSFLLYLVVLVVSVTSVMTGLDWLSSPAPLVNHPIHTASAPAKPAPAQRVKAAAPVAGAVHKQAAKSEPKPATATAAKSAGTAAAKTAASGGGDALARAVDVPGSEDSTNMDVAAEGITAAIGSGPRCDIQACETHYRSFRVSDCTYQPFDGPRRFCDKGHPPRATPVVRTSDVRPASPSCNYQACAAAYRSFDPGTCTYQPYDGPRRLCEK
jgi:hypothetical protein